MVEETQALSTQVDTLRNKDRLLQSVDESSLQAQLTSLVDAIPLDKSLPTLFTTLDGLTSETGVTIDDVSLASAGTISSSSAVPVGKTPSNEIAFTATVKGSSEQVLAFAQMVHAVRRLLTVKTMDMGVNQSGTFNLTVGMGGFFSPLGKANRPTAAEFTLLGQKEEALLRKVSAYPILTLTTQGGEQTITPLFIGKEDPFSL
jgi:Tfp pilus assembly protein PilO